MTILFSVVFAAAFPSRVRHEAALQDASRDASQSAAQETVSVPEFVSLINLSQFLLASEESSSASTDARQAAEALSARFAGSPTGSESEFLHVVVQQDPVAMNLLDAPKDPEKPPRVAVPSDDEAAKVRDLDGSKDNRETPKSEATDQPRTKVASDSMMRLGAPVPRRAKSVPSSLESQSGVRQQRRRWASADKVSRSGSVSSGGGADTERLVGFTGLSADQMLSN